MRPQSHLQAKAKCRMQNAETPGKAVQRQPRAAPKPRASHRADLDTRTRRNRLAAMKLTRQHSPPVSAVSGRSFSLGPVLGLCLVAGAGVFAGQERLILPAEVVADTEPGARAFDLVILGNEQLTRPLIGPAPEYIAKPQGNSADFLVKNQQVGIRIEEPVFVTPATSVSWVWRKDKGHVCIVQFELINPATNQRRYFGYGAGSLAEAPSSDPTVEVFVADTLPAQGARVGRKPCNDMKKVLGWEQARIASVYLSPWDGEPGVFADMVIRGVSKAGPAGPGYERLSRIGTGHYVPSKLPAWAAKHVERFDTSFEECAPGRNSNANEWSAFGAIGDRDFNCIGRDMYVRYAVLDRGSPR